MSRILESVRELLAEGETTTRLIDLTGCEPERFSPALTATVSALVFALSDRSRAGMGVTDEAVEAVVVQDDGSVVADVGRLVAGRQTALGEMMLDRLMGVNGSGTLAVEVAAVVQVEPSTVRKLLVYVTPVVIGVIARIARDERMTASAMFELLADERYRLDALAEAGTEDDDAGLDDGADGHGSRSKRRAKELAVSLVALGTMVVAAGAVAYQILGGGLP